MDRQRNTRWYVLIGIGLSLLAAVAGIQVARAATDNPGTGAPEAVAAADRQLSDEVAQFLTSYNEAFLTRDASKIAEYYHVPCVTVRGDGTVHAFQTRAEIEGFFQGVAERYARDGQASARFYDLAVVPIGARSVLATLTWEQLRQDKSVIRSWRHSYNLVRVNDRWQILTSTFHVK
jgi:hypothetical protein